jgi:sulfur-carrier protein
MAIVFIPSLLRNFTEGKSTLNVPGSTVREIIEKMDEKYPGIKDQLTNEDQLLPTLSLMVDGVISPKRLNHPVGAANEVHFLPVIRGG